MHVCSPKYHKRTLDRLQQHLDVCNVLCFIIFAHYNIATVLASPAVI